MHTSSHLSRVMFLLTAVLSLVLFLFGCSGESEKKAQSGGSASQQEERKLPAESVEEGTKQQVHSKSFIRLAPVQIMDTAGFGRAIPASTVLIPADWATQGGVVWQVNNRGCGRKNPHFSWGASSPDGKHQVQILPEESWTGNNLGTPPGNGCPNIWLRSAEEYLRVFVQHNRPQAQIREYQPRPDIASQYKHLEQVSPMPMGEFRTWIDSGQVLVHYSHQGQAMEELIAVLVVFQLNRMQGAVPGQIQEHLTISTLPGFAMRAPRGELNLKLAETIRTSGKANPEWVNLMAQHNAKIAQINRKGAADRHKIHMDTMREIGEMNQKSYEYRQRVQDEGHKKFSQMIREVESFSDPDGSEVELPSTHQNAWKLDDGTYILTDDHSFKPFRDLGVDGEQLERRE